MEELVASQRCYLGIFFARLWKTMKILVRIADVSIEIRTEPLQKISLGCCI
jgi:hypothetical protein